MATKSPREAPADRSTSAVAMTAVRNAAACSNQTGEKSAVIRLSTKYSAVLAAPVWSDPSSPFATEESATHVEVL
jgi:anti-sigma-K factor RskA